MIRIFRNTTHKDKVNVEIQSTNDFYTSRSIVSRPYDSYYDRDTRCTVIPIESKDDVINSLSELDREIIQVDLDIYKIAEKVNRRKKYLLDLRNTLEGSDSGIKFIDGYKLMPFQHTGVQFLYEVRNGILADKVGLGKTIQSFSAAYKLIKNGKAEKCFILCSSTLKRKWKRDIEKFLGIETDIIEGTINERDRMYFDWLNDKKKIFAIMSDDTFKKDFYSYIDEGTSKNIGVIVDEIQREKNATSKRSKAIRQFANSDYCKFRFGLSASYIENGLEDLFGIMLIVDDGIFGNSLTKFSGRYLVVNYFGKVTSYKNVEEVADKMKYCSIRRHKEQVKNQLNAFLPKINIETLWTELTRDQKSVYNEVLERVTENIANMEKAGRIGVATALSELIYLRQVCVSTELIGHSKKSSCKIDVLKEILPEIILDNKVVIFCFFTEFIDIMEREFKKLGWKCMAMHGKRPEGKSSVRQANIDLFQDSKDCNILLTSDILSEGVDLERTSYIINTDILWNPAKMMQRAGRIDRLNQKAKNIYVYNIWSEKGIEEQMYNIIYEKEEIAHKVMDDGYSESRVKKLTYKDIKKMLRRV